eukprot:PITA_33687
MSLQPQIVIEPFEKQALDFVGPINPSSRQRSYILFCTNYVTKWVEVESTNKVIEGILSKTVAIHRRNWADKLPEVLWECKTTWRNTNGFSPYELVYGKNPLFPIEFEIKTLRIALEVNLDLAIAQRHRLNYLNELEEKQLAAIQQTEIIEQQRVKWHDRFIKRKQFQKGYWALLYD